MANRAPSLANLPDELLADITVRVAMSSVKDFASLGIVNKAFRRHWNTEGVRRLCQAGNPDALYREGITSYFDSRRAERADEGLAQLQFAAENGHIKALFLYGMILVSSDLEKSDEGLGILATLMQPSLLESMQMIALMSYDLTFKYLSKLQGGPKKAVYRLEKFQADADWDCDDPDGNLDYMDDVHYCSTKAVEYDPPNDPMCQKCLWYRETNLIVQNS